MLWYWTRVWLLVAVLFIPAPARADSPQTLIDRAGLTLRAMRQDGPFNAEEKLRRAKAIMIIPELSKGGFVIGGQGGQGVLLVKRPSGEWSEPALFGIGGGTLGLQIGFQTAQMVLLVMTDPVLRTWLRGDFTFGTQDGVAVFAQGTQYSDRTSQGANVIAWVRATGAYAGITVEGTSISFDRDANRAYYGKPLTPIDIVIDGLAYNRGAEALRRAAELR
jgi:lipid-binding SYLF domain-containing protein